MECRIPKTVLIVIVVAVLGVGAAAVAIPLTSAPKFCATCHTIKPSYDGWVTVFGTPKKPEDLKATVYSEVCLSCHRNMLRISEIAERDLPGPLKKAGLIMAHRKHMEAFQKRGKGEGCTTCHATVVHAKPYKGYKIVIPRGHIRLDEIPKAEQASIETSMVTAHREADCFRCHG